MQAQMTKPLDILQFMFGGNATFTLVSVKTGARYTYKIRHCDSYDPRYARKGNVMSFVSVMTGSDNEANYSYLGLFRVCEGYSHGAKSKIAEAAPCSQAFAWFYKLIYSTPVLEADALPASVEFWHEGKCGRCGRKLTVPESIARGIGPECATRICEAA